MESSSNLFFLASSEMLVSFIIFVLTAEKISSDKTVLRCFIAIIFYQKHWIVKLFTNVFGKYINMIEIKFAENLRNLRNGAGLTQEKLAKKVNVDKRTVSAWEKKVCEPNLETLAKLCEIFNETFDTLLT